MLIATPDKESCSPIMARSQCILNISVFNFFILVDIV